MALRVLPQVEVTKLLLAWSAGDSSALEQLMPVVYQELRRLAKRHMGQERQGHTLQATALVNEVYLRLIDVNRIQWQNRAHFFAVSAQMMRRILVEFARRRHRQKRGDGVPLIPLDEALLLSDGKGADLLVLDEALTELAKKDSRMSQVVELRFFGGLSVDETAEVLKVSSDTVMREWKTAKIWLLREIRSNCR
jgi:RNA polymerase sigma factor (TIGR02999 family)